MNLKDPKNVLRRGTIGSSEVKKALEGPVREVEQEMSFNRERVRAKILVGQLAATRQGQKINPHLEIRNRALLLFQERLLKQLSEKIHSLQDLEKLRPLLKKIQSEVAVPPEDLRKINQPFPPEIGLGTTLKDEVKEMESRDPFFGNAAPGGFRRENERELQPSESGKVRREKNTERWKQFQGLAEKTRYPNDDKKGKKP